MDVKLIGESPSTGKGVGFFSKNIGDFEIWLVSFRSFNFDEYTVPKEGFNPDIHVEDEIVSDFGKTNNDIDTEPMLKKTLNYIQSHIN